MLLSGIHIKLSSSLDCTAGRKGNSSSVVACQWFSTGIKAIKPMVFKTKGIFHILCLIEACMLLSQRH